MRDVKSQKQQHRPGWVRADSLVLLLFDGVSAQKRENHIDREDMVIQRRAVSDLLDLGHDMLVGQRRLEYGWIVCRPAGLLPGSLLFEYLVMCSRNEALPRVGDESGAVKIGGMNDEKENVVVFGRIGPAVV